MLEEVAFRVALSNQAILFSSFQVPAIYLLKWKFPIFQVATSFQFTYFFLYAHNHSLSSRVYLIPYSVQRINHSKFNNILTFYYFLPLLYCYGKYYVALLNGFYQEFTSLYGYFQFSSVAQLCPTLCNPMNRSMPGLLVHHHLPEFTQTHIHRVSDAIHPSHPWSSPSPPAPNPSQHQSLFQ